MVEKKVGTNTGGFNVCTETAQEIRKAVQDFLTVNEKVTGKRRLTKAEVFLLREQAEFDAGFPDHYGLPTMRGIAKRKAEEEAYAEKAEREANKE